MKSILIIAVTALVIASFLIGRYLLKDLMRLFWKYSSNLFANYDATFFGELGVTIVIVVLLGLGAAAVQSAAAALFALATTNNIAEFCMTFRGVFSFHSSEIQSPSRHILWLFVSPLFKLLALYVFVWSIKAYFSSFNKRFGKTIYSESDCFYFSLIGVAFMFGLQVVLLTQSIDRLNMIFNCFNVILQNLSYFVYLFSIYWIMILKSNHQLAKNTDKFLIMGKVEKKIISTPWRVMAVSYVVSIILTLPGYLGLQWQRNNLILIFLLAVVLISTVILTKKVFSKSWNYLATIMFDTTFENPIKETTRKLYLDRRWRYVLCALAGIVVIVFSVFYPKPMVMFVALFLCLVVTAIITVLLAYGLSLLLGFLASIRRKNQSINYSFRDFTNYFKNTLTSFGWPLILGSGIIFLVFLLITIFPKSMDCSNVYMGNSCVVDPTGEVLMIDEEHGSHYSVPLTYDEIPDEFIKLLILNEDRGFFHQDSFLPNKSNKSNWHGLSPAILKRGGSNVNCQIVKQLTFKGASGYPRDGMRKLSDQLGSYQLSLKYDNKELIEIYSNVSSFNGGRGPLGLNAGALYTFGRPIGKLNSLEMWYLISTLPRSSYLTNGENKIAYFRVQEEPELVRNILLQKAKKWKEEHLISDGEYWQLCDDSLHFTNTRYTCDIPIGTRIMLDTLKQIPGRHDCHLTLNNEKALEKAYRTLKTKDVFRNNCSELQVAALVVESKTGHIIGHFSSSEVVDYVYEYTYPIGSIAKPAIILEILKSGVPIDFKLFDGKAGERKTPHNSHGWSNKFVGMETILSKSLNAPFANIQDLGVSPKAVFENLENDYGSMGIVKDIPSVADVYNYPLGIREMHVFEVAQLYQTIFNEGLFIPLSLEQKNDTVIPKKIWEEAHVSAVKNALHQTIESNGGTLHRYKNDLPRGRIFYGKTGTSSRQKDFWTVLSDGDIVIVSWTSYGKQTNDAMALGTEMSWGASTAGLFAVLMYNELLKTHNL